MHLDAEGGGVLLFELAALVPLHESGFPHAAVAHENQLNDGAVSVVLVLFEFFAT